MTNSQPRKILSVFGTRPEIIKMAPVIKALEVSPAFKSYVCTTSQHREMQDQMMRLFELEANYDLDIMRPGQSISYVTSKVLEGLDSLFSNETFDMVLVHGDTTTSFAAALAAFNHHIPVGHVEAGLRTYNLKAPFPEECNRQLTGKLATLHFAPTERASSHLLHEGVDIGKVFVTGNTVIDALFYMRDKITHKAITPTLGQKIGQLVEQEVPYVLITGHRRENFGEGFLNICHAIKTLSIKYPDWCFIYPVHLNPNVQHPVYDMLNNLNNVHLIPPIDYATFVYLLDRSRIVLTDSGGVQEEAPSLGKPVLVMRDVTERPEGIDAGTARLIGTGKEAILYAVSSLINNENHYKEMSNAINPYGDGSAANRISDILKAYFGNNIMLLDKNYDKKSAIKD